MLQLSDICKRFGAMSALEGVSLCARPGTVHGLLGENGAGKSTLMNILFGLLRPDAGTIALNGKPVVMRTPRAAQALGIGMVHQHFKLVPTLTVAENFSLALHAPVRAIRARAAELERQLRWSLPMEARIERLSVGQRQRVEIIKALLSAEGTRRILILDEPTAVLTPQETQELFAAVRRLRETGATILFISHKLAEIQSICDELTILRRGRRVHTGAAAELSAQQIATLMVGGAVELPTLVRREERSAAMQAGRMPELELSGVTAGILQGAALAVMAGEIVGIAGVDGNGQGDLVQAIIGGMEIRAGMLRIAGRDATRMPIRWRMDRMAYVPEDRQQQAMVLPLSIRDNLMLKDYRRRPFAVGGWLRPAAWRARSAELVSKYDVRCRSIFDAAGSLSGGNQQKMVLARELQERTDFGGAAGAEVPGKTIVVAANPTRGLDIGATAFVMRQLLMARAGGAAILLVHSDLDELLAMSDRVFVLYSGVLAPTAWPQCTKDQIGRRMLGLAD